MDRSKVKTCPHRKASSAVLYYSFIVKCHTSPDKTAAIVTSFFVFLCGNSEQLGEVSFWLSQLILTCSSCFFIRKRSRLVMETMEN